MIGFLLLFPLLISLVLFTVRSKVLNNVANIFYAAILLLSSGYMMFRPLSFAGYFAVDDLNILFLLVLAILYFGVSLYSTGFLKDLGVSPRDHTNYNIFLMLFVVSMFAALLCSHMGLQWVFIEATTITSVYLIYFNKTRAALEASWKYIFICSIGIAISYVGVILISFAAHTTSNTLFFSDLYREASRFEPFWLKLAFVFIIIGFGTKTGLAPVHAWLPDAHSEAPSPISALLSGTLLNTSFLAILRVLKIMELAGVGYYAHVLFLVMGILSVLVSAVFLVRVKNYKRMLAYSSIENMGIISLGIGAGGIGLFASLLH